MEQSDKTKDELFKLYRAVECSDEAIFMTDPDGLITFINPGFTNLYGYTTDEVVGKTTPRILKSGRMKEEEYKYFWDTILNNQFRENSSIRQRTGNYYQLRVRQTLFSMTVRL